MLNEEDTFALVDDILDANGLSPGEIDHVPEAKALLNKMYLDCGRGWPSAKAREVHLTGLADRIDRALRINLKEVEAATTQGEMEAYAVIRRLRYELEKEKQRQFIRRQAREQLDAEERAVDPAPAFDAALLDELLQREPEPPDRIKDILAWDGNALIVAQRKVGKTTLLLSLMRSLILGDDFLGKFTVRPVTGRVSILNYEMPPQKLAQWASEAGIPPDRLFVVNLRGKRNPFAREDDRAGLVQRLVEMGTETLIVDTFSAAFTGELINGQVRAWLEDLSLFAHGLVGAKDLILTAHAGWQGEHARGPSDLEDWPDSIMAIRLEDEKVHTSPRYFSAKGRDVDVAENQLSFDYATRSLTLTDSGPRHSVKAEIRSNEKAFALKDFVVKAVNHQPGLNHASLVKAIRQMTKGMPLTYQDNDVRAAARLAENEGLIWRQDLGPGKPTLHHPGAKSGELYGPA